MDKTRLVASAALSLLACGTLPPSSIDCSQGAGALSGTVKWGPTMRLVDKDLVLTGTTEHAGNLAIRRVLVAGLPATNQGFNFSAWTVTIPSANLAALADGQNQARVAVVAEDACNIQKEIASNTFTVAVRVEPADLVLTLPKGQSFVPADGQTAAEIRVVANAEAAGAAVKLSAMRDGAEVGRFQGVGSGNTVTLASDGGTQAIATALYVSDSAGSVLLGARSGSASFPARTLVVAGPPVLLPASASLKPGQRVRVTALSDGALKGCSATQATGITVTQAPSGSRRIDLDVAAALMLAAPSSLSITCTDPFGQSVGGTYDAAP